MKLNKYEIFIVTFLCYTSIHSLRTSYSYSKKAIAEDLGIDQKYMGIVDSLMLTFLGIGHFLHALYPIKKPVLSLWVAMIVCGINYALIPGCLNISALTSIYVLSVLMCSNGFLQSYTWPNLLMIINSKFNPQIYAVLLGFWSANANVGNIIGYGVFQLLNSMDYKAWEYGLVICAIYATANGVYIGLRFDELPIAGAKQIKQKSFMQYDTEKKLGSKEKREMITSFNSLTDKLLEKQEKMSETKSVHSEIIIGKANSVGGFSHRSIQTLKQISSKISRGTIKSIRLVDQPEKVAETPLSIVEVFKDPNVLLLTVTFSLSKSVIYGIMLWLPLYFKTRDGFQQYAGSIPIAYDTAAIFGSVGIGYLFKKIANKGLLMIPFMIVLFICFFLLLAVKFEVVSPYFVIISVVGFALGGIFNTLSGLVVMELTKVIPENLKTSSLGFYSALTMAVGNITTALTQILIGFVIGKQNQEGIFMVFMIYAFVCLVCLVFVAIISYKQKGSLSKGEVIVIEQIQSNEDDDSGGEEVDEPKAQHLPEQDQTKDPRKQSQ